MIENIKHYSMENLPSIFDEEALTALELVGRLAAKIRELIDNYNGLDVDIGDKLEEQDGRLEEMADEIATTKAELSEALETLIGTTMPAYVQKYVGDLLDAGAFDESMAEQLKNAAMLRETPGVLDADACEEIGYYFVSSGDGEWGNTPAPGGLLMVVNSGDPNRHYQIFVDYQTAFMYVRRTENGVFSDWELVNARDTLMQKYFEPGEVDLNSFGETGFYILGSSSTYTNTPDGAAAGLLIVCKDSKGFQTYQIFVNYTNNSMYTRRAYNGSFNEWVKMAVSEGTSEPAEPVEAAGAYNYEIERVSDTSFKLFQRGVRGYVCYTITRETDTALVKDVTRVQKITLCDANKNQVAVLSDVGHDNEGVIAYTDDPDGFIGGVHGYEKQDECYIVVDGVMMTLEAVTSGHANVVEIIYASTLYLTDGTTRPAIRVKKVLFDGKMNVVNRWMPKIGYYDKVLDHVKCAMLSVHKDCFREYHNVADTRSRRADAGVTGSERSTTGQQIPSMIFYGTCRAQIKVNHHPGEKGALVERYVDYGDRCKVYYECSSNLTFAKGTNLISDYDIIINY